MKIITPRKSILSILVCIIVLAALLIPAIPVYATNTTQPLADWPLTLVGYNTLSISQNYFETLALAHPVSWNDTANSQLWDGVAFWRLVALVDGGSPDTLNADSSIYSIKLTGINLNGSLYEKTIAPNTASFPYVSGGIGNDNVLVANKLNSSTLPELVPGDTTKLLFPLKATGPSPLSTGNKIGALVKIELLNLPAAAPAISVSPSTQTVANGSNFSVDINIDNPLAPCNSWASDISFDPNKMTVSSITEGNYLSSAGTTSAAPYVLDNNAGTVSGLGWYILGSSTKTGSGKLCTINFTSKPNVNAVANITVSNPIVGGPSGGISGVTATSGTVTIGSQAPDLVVSAASTADAGGVPGQYTIGYTITNSGFTTAAASTTSIVIDGGTAITIACPSLAIGASDSQTTAIQTVSGNSDAIVITADSASVVTEASETNNSFNLTRNAANVTNNNVPIDGTIAPVFTFTAPGAVNWNPLTPGMLNEADRGMNITSNQDWQVTVQGDNSGYMTKYNGTYVPAKHLQDRLYVVSGDSREYYLNGSVQLLADGSPSELTTAYSRDITTNFFQQVYFTDPALEYGYNYHIVLAFVATSTGY